MQDNIITSISTQLLSSTPGWVQSTIDDHRIVDVDSNDICRWKGNAKNPPKFVKISFSLILTFDSFPFILPSTIITTPQQVHCILLLLAVVLLLNSNRRWGGVLFKGTPVIPLFDMHSPLIPPRVTKESTARGWFLLHHHSPFIHSHRRTSVCPLHIPCSHIINGFRDKKRLSTDRPSQPLFAQSTFDFFNSAVMVVVVPEYTCRGKSI